MTSDSNQDEIPTLEEVSHESQVPQPFSSFTKQSRRYAKMMAKLGARPDPNYFRICIKGVTLSFVVQNPEVYRFSGSNTFVVFGNISLDESSAPEKLAARDFAEGDKAEELAAFKAQLDQEMPKKSKGKKPKSEHFAEVQEFHEPSNIIHEKAQDSEVIAPGFGDDSSQKVTDVHESTTSSADHGKEHSGLDIDPLSKTQLPEHDKELKSEENHAAVSQAAHKESRPAWKPHTTRHARVPGEFVDEEIQLVMSQANVSREIAIDALTRNKGDIISSIMEFTS